MNRHIVPDGMRPGPRLAKCKQAGGTPPPAHTPKRCTPHALPSAPLPIELAALHDIDVLAGQTSIVVVQFQLIEFAVLFIRYDVEKVFQRRKGGVLAMPRLLEFVEQVPDAFV